MIKYTHGKQQADKRKTQNDRSGKTGGNDPPTAVTDRGTAEAYRSYVRGDPKPALRQIWAFHRKRSDRRTAVFRRGIQ